jgi:ketosteroid isomerase-like protein
MKHRQLTLIIVLLIGIIIQDLRGQKNELLASFQPLLNRSWYANGEWGDGTIFKQKVKFVTELNGNLIKAVSEGFVDEARTEWGTRNHGIRSWNEECKCNKFWEFDVFGGMTTGKIELRKDTILYHYNYGGADITDSWMKVSDYKYDFIVGDWDGKSWKQKYLSTSFIAQPDLQGNKEDLDQIITQSMAFSATYMQEDHEKLAAFYTEKGVIMPGGADIIRGREAIANRWQLPDGVMIHNHRAFPEKIELIGDTAIDYGYYEGSSQDPGKDVSVWKGKYVIIWKKVDGNWLMDIDIWNRVN